MNESITIHDIKQDVLKMSQKPKITEKCVELELEVKPKPDKLQRLSKALRWLGALTLAGSSLAFVLQGWANADSMMRYYSFLLFTALLSGAGFYCGIKLKEDKGARTFLGVAAMFAPAHFCQLGALVYSLVFGTPSHLPNLFVFTAPSATVVALTIAIAMIVLVPVTFTGLSSLARPHAAGLTSLYFAANALLLLPVRQGDTVALIATVAVAALFFFDTKYFRGETRLNGWEGRAARMLVFLPIVPLLGRTMVLYQVTLPLLSSVLLAATYLLFSSIPECCKTESGKSFSHFLGATTLTMAWICFCHGVLFNSGYLVSKFFLSALGAQASITVVVVPLALAIFGLSFIATGIGGKFRSVAAATSVFAAVIQLFSTGGVLASFICLAVAVTVITAAFVMEERALLTLGGTGFILSMLYHLRSAAELYTMSPWLSLAVTGTIVIFGATYLERNGKALTLKASTFKKRIDSWAS